MKRNLLYTVICMMFICLLSGCSSQSDSQTITFKTENKKNQKISVIYNVSDGFKLQQNDNEFLIINENNEVVVNGMFLEAGPLIQYKYYATAEGIEHINNQKKEDIDCGTAYSYIYEENDKMVQYVYAIDLKNSDYGIAMYNYNDEKGFKKAIQNLTFSVNKDN